MINSEQRSDQGLAFLKAKSEAQKVELLREASKGPTLKERLLVIVPSVIILFGAIFLFVNENMNAPKYIVLLSVLSLIIEFWILQRRMDALSRLVSQLVDDKTDTKN